MAISNNLNSNKNFNQNILSKYRKEDIKSIQELPDSYKFVFKEDEPSNKKNGKILLSALMPGTGQIANGEWGKGLGFVAIGTLLPIITSFLAGNLVKSKNITKTYLVMSLTNIATIIGTRIWSAMDISKNCKQDTTIIIPKDQKSSQKNINRIA